MRCYNTHGTADRGERNTILKVNKKDLEAMNAMIGLYDRLKVDDARLKAYLSPYKQLEQDRSHWVGAL